MSLISNHKGHRGTQRKKSLCDAASAVVIFSALTIPVAQIYKTIF
jgi:hypothetical protein